MHANPCSTEHGIYISVIEMNYEKNQLHVQIKVFENDLRDAIANEKGIDLNNSKEELRTLENFQTYFDKYLVINNEAELLNLKCVSFTVEGDAYFIKFESEVRAIRKISMTSTYFMDLFPSQQNILQFSQGEKKLFNIFKKGKEKFEFSLSD